MATNRSGVTLSRNDLLTTSLIFLAALLVFWFSPVSQVTDSHYSLLLSESLLRHRTFTLDHYAIPRLEPQSSVRDDYVANGNIWQLEQWNNRLYYYFPPGSSILSIPYVALARLFGVSIARPDGTYDAGAEVRLETGLAAILMALFACLVFLTARMLLPLRWSLLLALTIAFGTQVWSTMSRALWSHTWEVVLVSLIVFMLVKSARAETRVNPIVLATLIAWTYFVRPSGIIVVTGVTIYLFLYERQVFWKYLATGFLWLSVFVSYSWLNFGRPLPSYYQASRLRLDLFPIAFAGNLFSPARGVFIYVPIALFVGYLLVRYWRQLELKPLAMLALFVMLGHLLIVSSFANRWGDWWGGASFGPRYLADLLPWFSLLAVLGLNAMLRSRKKIPKRALIAGAALLAMSVFVNARGALARETWQWTQPVTDQQMRALLWDWRHPQFLAGLQRPAPLIEVPLIPIGDRIKLYEPVAEKYLWYGWSGSEPSFRWTDGREAALVFSLHQIEDVVLHLKAAPFVLPHRVSKQQVAISINGHQVEIFELDSSRELTVRISKELLSRNNALMLELPNATAPSAVGGGNDHRLLGLRVEWIELQRP